MSKDWDLDLEQDHSVDGLWAHRVAFTKLADELAHDFNNALTSILGSADILRSRLRREQANDAEDQELDTIRKEAERAAQILRRLMLKSDRPLLTEAVRRASGAAAGEADGESEETAAGSAIRVLLAEDDDSVRSCASLALRSAGYSVTACASGAEAWEIFQRRPRSFQLLVTDLSMPLLDGASLIQRAKLLHPRLRVLLISGYCDDRAAFELISRGDAAFLPKPFALSQLLDQVRGQLDEAA